MRHLSRRLASATFLMVFAASTASAQDAPGEPPSATSESVEGQAAEETKERKKGFPLLFYLPNRLFDLTDVVRARVRVGPGFQVGARATRPLSFNVGMHGSVWGGLRGPRGQREIAWPAGFEAFSGVQASVAKVGTDQAYYGPTEVGADFQAAFFGLAIGVAPLEIVDLLLGFFFIDIRADDL